MRRYIAFIIILFTPWVTLAADSSPTFQLSGDVSLLSHYVKEGLSQSDKSPALQGSFWFNFGPQFRLGLWGSNTNYPNSDDHFLLRLMGDIKVSFSQNTSATLSYSQNQFYTAGDRNGHELGLHINLAQFRVLYDIDSNWEGTDADSKRYAFGLISNIGNWKWNNEVGYNTPDLDSINSYFDGRTGLGTKWGVIFFEGAITATSESSQFNGAGDVFFILSASTDL